MSLMDKITDYFVGQSESARNAQKEPNPVSKPKPALPTLPELRRMIIKSQLLFRQSLAEAEASAKKSQELYNRKFTATPEERKTLTQLQASQDRVTRQKMAQAQVSAKNTSMLQDVEVVMQIEDAFANCGIAVSDEREAATLPDLLKEVQKEMQIAEQAIGATMMMAKGVGATVSIPMETSFDMAGESAELEALWEQIQRETDPAKREELERKIKEKDHGKPVQVTLGAI